MASGEIIYHTGLALIGFAVFLAAVAIPIFIFTGKRLMQQLVSAYGEPAASTARRGEGKK